MQRLLHSMLRHKAQDSDIVMAVVERLLATPELLHGDEVEYLVYFRDAITAAGYPPSKSAFLQQFPDVEFKDDWKLALPQDLPIRAARLQRDRRRKVAQVQLSELAERVGREGLSAEDVSLVQGLRRQEAGSDGLEPAKIGAEGYRELWEAKKNRSVGLTTWIHEIDECAGGLAMERVLVIAGFTGSFKTTLAVNLAYRNSLEHGYNVIYVSLEMGRQELLDCFLCRHSFNPKFKQYLHLPLKDIHDGTLDPDMERYLMEVVWPDWDEPNDKKGKVAILTQEDFPSFEEEVIRDRLIQVSEQIGGVDAVFWDHLQLMKFLRDPGRGQDEKAVMNSYVSFIRGLSFDLGGRKTLQVILSQANREGEARARRRQGLYDLQALSEANELERSAHWVIFLWASEGDKGSHVVRVTMPKNRSGRTIEEHTTTTTVRPEAYFIGDPDAGGGLGVVAQGTGFDDIWTA